MRSRPANFLYLSSTSQPRHQQTRRAGTDQEGPEFESQRKRKVDLFSKEVETMASRQQPGGGLLVVVVLLLVSALWAEAAVDCNTVKSDLVGCVGYLESGTGNPTPQCCDGVRKLSSASATTADRRKTCWCIKSLAAPYPNIKDPAVGKLPTLCGVKLSFRPSITTNCDTIP